MDAASRKSNNKHVGVTKTLAGMGVFALQSVFRIYIHGLQVLPQAIGVLVVVSRICASGILSTRRPTEVFSSAAFFRAQRATSSGK